MTIPPNYTHAASFQLQSSVLTSQGVTPAAKTKKRIQKVEDSTVDSSSVMRAARRARQASPPNNKFNWNAMIERMNKLAFEDCDESDSDPDMPALRTQS